MAKQLRLTRKVQIPAKKLDFHPDIGRRRPPVFVYEAARGEGKRIVVVEDNPERIELFRLWFAKHDLVIVGSVADALDAIQATPANVLFLDYDLHAFPEPVKPQHPFETGLDVVTALLRTVRLKNRPKIFIVHSRNDLGSSKMFQALCSQKNPVVQWPFDYEWKGV